MIGLKSGAVKGFMNIQGVNDLNLGIPILLIGPSRSDIDAIADTTGLVRKLTEKDIEGMCIFYQEVKSGNIPTVKNPDAYVWPNVVKELDAVPRKVISAGACPS